MKKILFVFTMLVYGLSVNSQSQYYFPTKEDKELADSLEQFISSSRYELPNPFSFQYKGEKMLIYKSYNTRSDCYAYFTISPGAGCAGDIFTARVIFVTGTVPWTNQWFVVQGNITWLTPSNVPEISFIANGPFMLNCSATDKDLCSVTNSQPITATVNQSPTLNIETLGKPCHNAYVAKTNAMYTEVTWSNGDKGFGGDYDGFPGTIAIATATNSFGCITKDTVALSQKCTIVDTTHIPVFDTTHIIFLDTVTFYDTVGCNGSGGGMPPVAKFTMDVSENTCGVVTVTFHDQSTGSPTYRIWNFPGGDINTSNQANPVVRYSTLGHYSPKLTVSNSIGADSHVEINGIYVGNVPQIIKSSDEDVHSCHQSVSLGVDVIGETNVLYKWSPVDDINCQNCQNVVVNPPVDRTYKVIITLENGCAYLRTFDVLVDCGTANPEVESDDIVIYPNPVSDVLHIQSSSQKEYKNTLIDVSGRVVCTGVTDSFSVKGFAPGMYVLKVFDKHSTIPLRIEKVIVH